MGDFSLLRNKYISYLRKGKVPRDCEFLDLCDIKDVIISGNINTVRYCVEKLHMDTTGGISIALQLNKADIAHYLLAEGAHYDPYELDYCHSADVAKIALLMNWEFTSTSIKYMSNEKTGSLDTLKVLLREYGQSTAQVVASKYKEADDECLAYIIHYYDVRIHMLMIETLCLRGMILSLKAISRKTNIINYIHCIASSTTSVIEHFLHKLKLQITDLPFYSLFKPHTDSIVYAKLKKYAHQIPDFAIQLDQVCLLDEYTDEDHIECAIYVINTYNVSHGSKSIEDTCIDILSALWSQFEDTTYTNIELREFLCAMCDIFPKLDMSEFTDKYLNTDDVTHIGDDFSRILVKAKYIA